MSMNGKTTKQGDGVMADQEKTTKIHEWIKSLDDDRKLRFAINWKIPHTLFNVACGMYPGGAAALQDIDWYQIFKSKDLGTWSHGGRVRVLCLGG